MPAIANKLIQVVIALKSYNNVLSFCFVHNRK